MENNKQNINDNKKENLDKKYQMIILKNLIIYLMIFIQHIILKYLVI